MFTPEAFIDTVQNGKKQVVSTFVTDKTLKNGLIEVIDAQTVFAKTVAAKTMEISESMAESFKAATTITK